MTGCVYFIKPIGLPGPIKIGFSEAPANRLQSLSEWSPIKLEIVATIPGTYALERNIQDCLARSVSHKEWFFPTDEVLAVVNAVKNGVPIEEAIDLSKRYRIRARSEASKRKVGIRMLMYYRLPSGVGAPRWIDEFLNNPTNVISAEDQVRVDKFEQYLRSLPIRADQ